jgi:hypothetical protein
MNKKVLGIAVSLLTAVILATPLVGSVFALGKPNKAENLLYHSFS